MVNLVADTFFTLRANRTRGEISWHWNAPSPEQENLNRSDPKDGVAYNRTMKAAKRAFWGWHESKRNDAVAECVAKLWDSWSRLLVKGKNPEPMTSALIRFAILWVRYDRRIAGRARTPDVFDFSQDSGGNNCQGKGKPAPAKGAAETITSQTGGLTPATVPSKSPPPWKKRG